MGGYPLKIDDTAGLRRTADPLEAMGVARARDAAALAHAGIVVLAADHLHGWVGVFKPFIYIQRILYYKKRGSALLAAVH